MSRPPRATTWPGGKAAGKRGGGKRGTGTGKPALRSARRTRVGRPGRGRWLWLVARWGIIVGVWGGVAITLTGLWLLRDLPRPQDALAAVRRPSMVLTDPAGRMVAHFGDLAGHPVRLASLPAYLPQAAVAIEDRRFWLHGAFDWPGILRAGWADISAGHIVQGGSGIAQQVAKMLFLSNARTWQRKVQEMVLTSWLLRHFSHRQILEIWLNRVYLGGGAWGVDAAAHLYFGVPAARLSLWQAAVLAGLPPAPARLNPFVDPTAAAARARVVLAAMVRSHDITAAQADAAAAQIHFTAPPAGADWFARWAAESAVPLLPPSRDATLVTSLDPVLQARTQADLDAMLAGPGRVAGVGQGAVVVLDAATGAVRAMVGGRGGGARGYNRAVLARRQPGSAFKPFVWLTALEQGARPDDLVEDAPLRVGNWRPRDFERRYEGMITLTRALAISANTVSVRLLLRDGGAARVAETAHRLGIADKLPDTPSLALGTGDVGLLELTTAYAAFFNGGYRVQAHGILRLRADGRPIALPPTPPRRVITADQAAMMAQMMGAVVAEGTGQAAAIPGQMVAGKTGTTQSYRDAWFVGSTRGVMIGVWMGNDNDHPMRNVVGGSLPAKLFKEVALQLR